MKVVYIDEPIFIVYVLITLPSHLVFMESSYGTNDFKLIKTVTNLSTQVSLVTQGVYEHPFIK